MGRRWVAAAVLALALWWAAGAGALVWPPPASAEYGHGSHEGLVWLDARLPEDAGLHLRRFFTIALLRFSRRVQLRYSPADPSVPANPALHAGSNSGCLVVMIGFVDSHGKPAASPAADRRSYPSGDNEAYQITSRGDQPLVVVTASSEWGVLRALQSLQQLLVPPDSILDEEGEAAAEKEAGQNEDGDGDEDDIVEYPGMSEDEQTTFEEAALQPNNPDNGRPLPPSLRTSRRLIGVPFLVRDRPEVSFRSVLLDAASNHLPLPVLLRFLEFAASCKLNAVQLRLSSDHAFVLDVPSLPGLAKPSAAEGPDARIYTAEQVRLLVSRGRFLGVRVIPSLSLPSQAAAWSIGPTPVRDVVLRCPRTACTAPKNLGLHPYRNRTYEVIEEVLRTVSALFPDPYLHLGGEPWSPECLSEAKIRPEEAREYFERRLRELVSSVLPDKMIIRWADAFAGMEEWDMAQVQSSNVGKPVRGDVPIILSSGWSVGWDRHCLSAEECYTEDSWKLRDRSLCHGVELSLWDFSTARLLQSDVHSQIVGFSGAAWRFGTRPAYAKVEHMMRRFCNFLIGADIVDLETQCLLAPAGNSRQYHQEFQEEASRRSQERDELLCKRQNSEGV
ncbi:MAG: family 20 glycosylhydrolase, partial [archaeon]|nr:family 20 glycosylhydrolase [archaeon]